jgi:glutathione S-transferase
MGSRERVALRYNRPRIVRATGARIDRGDCMIRTATEGDAPRLYYHPGNANIAPHVVLEEIGAPFALELVDRKNDAHKSAAYLALNPNGAIPVLVDGDVVLYESAAICLYLADKHPEAALVPALRTPERAQCYKWLFWCTNTLQAMLMHYFYPERLVDAGDDAAAKQVSRTAEARIVPMLDQLDAQLASHGGPWMLASGYSVVDPFVLMLCRWTRNHARPARSLAQLGPYLARMLERPAVRRMFAAESISTPLV